MTYRIVTNGPDYGTLEEGKPIPHGFSLAAGGKIFTKEEAQAWFDEEMRCLGLLDLYDEPLTEKKV